MNLTSAEILRNKAFNEIEIARKAGKRVVFTNGCFDLLHPGHVRNLQEARSLGDCLVVGLNTDESVARLKGSNRPILPLNARIEILSALSCVNWVIPFGDQADDTPKKLISEIMPHVLAKGGDYEMTEIVGADTVTAGGGEVVRLTYHHDWSTTSLIRAIKSGSAIRRVLHPADYES